MERGPSALKFPEGFATGAQVVADGQVKQENQSFTV
jgi:hypothetical protein